MVFTVKSNAIFNEIAMHTHTSCSIYQFVCFFFLVRPVAHNFQHFVLFCCHTTVCYSLVHLSIFVFSSLFVHLFSQSISMLVNGCRTLYLFSILHFSYVYAYTQHRNKKNMARIIKHPYSSSYFSLMLIIFCTSETHSFFSFFYLVVVLSRLQTVYFRLIHFT